LGRKKGFALVYGWVGLDKKNRKEERGNSGFLRVLRKKRKRGISGPLRVLFGEVVPAFPPANSAGLSNPFFFSLLFLRYSFALS
jgi:hypothetical protein